MKATKIRMKNGCQYSNSVLEINEIYIEGAQTPGFYKKADVHDCVKENPGSIVVGIFPCPALIPAISINGEKYVKSSPNGTTNDNLLSLPRV